MLAATDRTRELSPTSRGFVVHDQGRRPSYDTQFEVPARFESALPSYDVVLRTTQSMPSLAPIARLPLGLRTPISGSARVAVMGCMTDEPCIQSVFARFATSSPTLRLTRRWDMASACGISGKPRVFSAIPLPARIGPATVSFASSSELSRRPPTSASIRSDETLSIDTRSSATTPLSSTGYASSPLSAVSDGPLSPVNGRERASHSDLATTMRNLAAQEREVSDQINARIAALEAMVASRAESTLNKDHAVTPASRPFTPVYIPPGFEEGLASYFDGTFNPHSPHRRRRGTLPPQGGLRVDTRGAAGDHRVSDSRPLTPVPLPPNFEHDLQEYFRANMEPHSPESRRRRAEHRERAATMTARDREPSVASEWPSSPETPPLDEDGDSDLSDDPIEVIEGVLKAECQQLYVTLSRRGSIATAPGAERNASHADRPMAETAEDCPSAKAAALGDYVEETKTRKTKKDRDALCSKWLQGLEPVMARGRPFA